MDSARDFAGISSGSNSKNFIEWIAILARNFIEITRDSNGFCNNQESLGILINGFAREFLGIPRDSGGFCNGFYKTS